MNMDYYSRLGVAKTATVKEITSSYRKLALKYHPDRNRGENQKEAAEHFASISEAFAVLSDTTKRRQYDLHGGPSGASDAPTFAGGEAVSVEDTGLIARWAAAQLSRIGVPVPTTVSPQVLGEAKQLARSESDKKKGDDHQEAPAVTGDTLLPVPRELFLGKLHSGKLSLSSAAFFRLRVSRQMARDGVIIAARSRRKNDRFRLLIFDHDGDVKVQSESCQLLEGTESAGGRPVARCRLFLTPYATVTVNIPFPSLDHAVPQVCSSLDTLEEREATVLQPGVYLLGLYNGNFLSQMEYSIAAVPAEPTNIHKKTESPPASTAAESPGAYRGGGGDDGDDDGYVAAAAARVFKLSSEASALRDEKAHLTSLGERIILQRAALERAEMELRESLTEARRAEESVAEVIIAHADAQQAIIDSSLARLTRTGDKAIANPSANPIMAGGELIGDEQVSNGAQQQQQQQQRHNNQQQQPPPQRGFGAILRRFSRSSDAAALEADGTFDASAGAAGSSLGL